MSHPAVPAYAGSRIDKDGWWVLANADDHPLAGPFSTIGEANVIAGDVSAGRPWRYGPDTTTWLQAQGFLA